MSTILDIPDGARFYCYLNGVDMRKGIHSLYNFIKRESDFSAISGDLYVFISNNRKSIKILRWQREGFILYHKRLELGLYNLPLVSDDKSFFELDSAKFNSLLGSIAHKSAGGELKRLALSTL